MLEMRHSHEMKSHILPRPRAVKRLDEQPVAAAVAASLATGDLTDARTSQDYRLDVRRDGVRLLAGGDAGLRYGLDTLRQLVDGFGDSVPGMVIEDGPWLVDRGVYLESTHAASAFDVDDWKTVLAQLASYRFNRVGLALYGCWDLRHDGERSETMLVSLDDFPLLRTTSRVRYFDPHEGREVVAEFTSPLRDDAAFGAVVDEARRLGVEVTPCFAGPGHNTLIPRLYPEMSAKDADGRPSGYSYCVTDPVACAGIRRLYANLVRQHLQPHGLTTLGCGGDELYPLRNIEPDDPLREVSPWCRCATCAELSPGEQLLAFYRLVTDVLDDAGIAMVVWHDSLLREGVLDDFARWGATLRHPPIVSWWHYGEPLPEPPTTGLPTWVTPTVGLVPALFVEDFGTNIEGWMQRAAACGADGVYAYNLPDPVFHHNYALLGQQAWNRDVEHAQAFESWVRHVWPETTRAARHALHRAWESLGDHALVTYVIDHLLTYFSTAPHGVRDHPFDLLAGVADATPDLTKYLNATARTLHAAAADLPASRSVPPWPDVAATLRGEWRRTAAHIELVLAAVAAARGSSSELEEALRALRHQGRGLLGTVADHRIGPNRPYVLREHWYVIRGLEDAVRALHRTARREQVYEAWRFS